ncbi:hypothetical protein [Rahnella sp. ChDrAdgB13]|uniref:hypothetical protein n=1 Tax=Rahnella sp. ChDrAdgB13 TaxID=1850581 RepID=UPI001AD8700F|nr:hypothetical protein [Rahnella sp. ChDrAdgB13]
MTNQNIANTAKGINSAADTEVQPQSTIQQPFERKNYAAFISEDALNRLDRLCKACTMLEVLTGAFGELSIDKAINAQQVEALLEYLGNDIRAIQNGLHMAAGIFTAWQGDAGLEYIHNNQ